MIPSHCRIKKPDKLQTIAFYKLMNPDVQSGLSVLQASVIAGDTHTAQTILQFSPSTLDICIALLTTGTGDFLITRMRSSACHQLTGNALLCSDSLQLQRTSANENSNMNAVIQLLMKMINKFQNASLLREVVSKGNLSQLLKIISHSTRFHEDRKSYLGKKDRHGTTLLMSACLAGKPEVVEFLLANGARVQGRDNKQRTALHFAASNNSLAIVKLLLQAGAWMHDEDCNGLTPLHCASQHGRTDTVVFLLENGCDVNRSTRPIMGNSHNGRSGDHLEQATALHLAACNGHNDTVSVLIQKGAKINNKTSSGQTPLMLAAEEGHVTTVKCLLSKGADINASDVSGKTALEFAVLEDQLSVAKFLVKAGIDLNVFVGSEFCKRMLISAVRKGNRDTLKSLINAEEKAIEMLQKILVIPWNRTLLHVAAETKGNIRVVDLLAMIFSDVNVTTSRGQTPLHFAADVNIAKRLVEAGAEVNATDQFGESPAMAAARSNHWEIVEFLLCESTIVKDKPNHFGQTLVYMATTWQAPQAVSKLLEIKASELDLFVQKPVTND